MKTYKIKSVLLSLKKKRLRVCFDWLVLFFLKEFRFVSWTFKFFKHIGMHLCRVRNVDCMDRMTQVAITLRTQLKSEEAHDLNLEREGRSRYPTLITMLYLMSKWPSIIIEGIGDLFIKPEIGKYIV